MIGKKLFTTLIFFIFVIQNLLAQVNNDSIFSAAVEQAKAKKYSESCVSAGKVLATDSGRVDVMIFLANVYAWQHDFDHAKAYIGKAYKLENSNTELYDSWLNILLWNNEPEALTTTCNIAESHNYKNHYNLFVKRLLANQSLKQYGYVIELVENENNKDFHDSAQVNYLYREALMLSNNRFFSAYYSLDIIDNELAQHAVNVDYSFKIGGDRLIFRINAARRFGSNGIQLESDFYKVLKGKGYMYFNYGYSFDELIFPQHRAGYEYYFPIKPDFEASLGGRYLRFTDRNVYIATGHLSKYFGKNWFSLRPFYITQEMGNSFSLVSNYRRYSKSDLKYWGMEFAYGNSPDERFTLSQNDQFFLLNSYRFKLERNLIVGKINELKIRAAYADEEYVPGSYRNRYTLELLFKFRMR